MNIRIKNIDSGELKGTIIPIFENKISKLSGDDDILKSIPFEGKADEVFYTTYLDKGLKYRIYVGLGKDDELNGEVLRNAIARGINTEELSRLRLLHNSVKAPNNILKAITACKLVKVALVWNWFKLYSVCINHFSFRAIHSKYVHRRVLR